MTDTEAIKIMQGWLDYLDREKVIAKEMAQLARLAKTDQQEARRRLAQLDRSPRVFDGARLADAVRHACARLA